MPPRTERRTVDGPAFDEVLEFMRLIWAIDHELERVSKQMETRLGLTIPQRMCLLLIDAQPGILASRLAEILHLHRGTMTGVLRRLEAAGLISRRTDSSDARRAGLRITKAGARLKARSDGTFEAAVRRLLAGSPSGDRAATVRVLTALRHALAAAGAEARSRTS